MQPQLSEPLIPDTLQKKHPKVVTCIDNFVMKTYNKY